MRIWKKIKEYISSCEHEFDIEDIHFTNIPEPQEPNQKNLDYKEYQEDFRAYWDEYWNGDWLQKRVYSKCIKCGEVVHASCGLNLGKLVRQKKSG